jgi:hypothetical protein
LEGASVTGTLAVAIYAAVVATGGLAWQIVDQVLGRRTRLEVTVSRTPGEGIADQNVTVRVVNKSRHPVPIAGSFVWQTATKRHWLINDPANTSPTTLAPRDGMNMFEELSELQGLQFGEPAIAVVVTQDGSEFRSSPTVIVPRPPPQTTLS